MRTIGLTGGIASGKSTVSRMLAELGAPVIDADQLARAVVEPGAEVYHEIIAAFGQQILLPDGRIDRKALGARVFADPAARKRLESIVHPAVQARRAARMRELAIAGHPVAVLDVPLLFEVGMDRQVDEIWVVWVDPETQLRRLMERDSLDEPAARQRMAAQWPLSEKRSRAHVIIDNTGSLEATRAQVAAAWLAALAAAERGAGPS